MHGCQAGRPCCDRATTFSHGSPTVKSMAGKAHIARQHADYLRCRATRSALFASHPQQQHTCIASLHDAAASRARRGSVWQVAGVAAGAAVVDVCVGADLTAVSGKAIAIGGACGQLRGGQGEQVS